MEIRRRSLPFETYGVSATTTATQASIIQGLPRPSPFGSLVQFRKIRRELAIRLPEVSQVGAKRTRDVPERMPVTVQTCLSEPLCGKIVSEWNSHPHHPKTTDASTRGTGSCR